MRLDKHYLPLWVHFTQQTHKIRYKTNDINSFPNALHKTSAVATTRIWTHRLSDFITDEQKRFHRRRANSTDPNEVKNPHTGNPKVSFTGLKPAVLTEAKTPLNIHGISVTNRPPYHNSPLCIPVGTKLQWIISYWKMTERWSVRKYYANTEITFCDEESIIWSKHESECFYNT